MQKFQAKQSHVGSGVQGKGSIYIGFKVSKTFWITFHTAQHFFTLLPVVILRLLIKIGPHGWRVNYIRTVNLKRLQEVEFQSAKGALPSLRQFLKIESLLKMMINAFYFTFKSSSRSQDIQIFALIFRSCHKTA